MKPEYKRDSKSFKRGHGSQPFLIIRTWLFFVGFYPILWSQWSCLVLQAATAMTSYIQSAWVFFFFFPSLFSYPFRQRTCFLWCRVWTGLHHVLTLCAFCGNQKNLSFGSCNRPALHRPWIMATWPNRFLHGRDGCGNFDADAPIGQKNLGVCSIFKIWWNIEYCIHSDEEKRVPDASISWALFDGLAMHIFWESESQTYHPWRLLYILYKY